MCRLSVARPSGRHSPRLDSEVLARRPTTSGEGYSLSVVGCRKLSDCPDMGADVPRSIPRRDDVRGYLSGSRLGSTIRRGELGSYAEIGRWWYGENEIDLVGLAPNDDRIFFAECKWTAEPVGYALVDVLREDAEHVRWDPNTRDERFALFSRSGFVTGLEDNLGENWSLFSPPELESLLSPSENGSASPP